MKLTAWEELPPHRASKTTIEIPDPPANNARFASLARWKVATPSGPNRRNFGLSRQVSKSQYLIALSRLRFAMKRDRCAKTLWSKTVQLEPTCGLNSFEHRIGGPMQRCLYVQGCIFGEQLS